MPDHNHAGPPAQQMTPDEAVEAARLLAEGFSTDAPVATHYRDTQPTSRQGNAVPIPQPGRPPMSQRATDHASLVLAYSLGSVPASAALSLLLWSLSGVDPTTLAIATLAPPAAVTAIGLTARMIGRAVCESASALPEPTIHQHTGPTHVQHTHLHTETRWFSKTTNHLPDER